jgi:hypothetical protein
MKRWLKVPKKLRRTIKSFAGSGLLEEGQEGENGNRKTKKIKSKKTKKEKTEKIKSSLG